MIQLQKAKRTLAKVKLAIGGPSGSGKTMSSLLLAYGLVKAAHPEYSDAECWDKICIIDTENGSASLYVNTSVGQYRTGEYYTIPMEPPYDFETYENSIHAAEQAGMEVIIVDSLSHLWVGEGGALDVQGKIAQRTGNSYTAWRDVTPKFNHLMDTILQSRSHIICDLRAKTEYTQEKNASGKTVVRNIGMGLQFRDSSEFDFSIVFMLDQDHTANATKDRTGLFDGKYFTITPETGKQIYQWLQSGAPEAAPMPVPQPAAPAPEPIQEAAAPEPDRLTKARAMVDEAVKKYLAANPDLKKQVIAEIKEITGGSANYMAIEDVQILGEIYKKYSN